MRPPRPSTLLYLLTAVAWPCPASGQNQTTEEWLAEIERSPDALTPEARTALFFDKACRAFNCPGASIAVAHEGKIVFSMGFGYADLDNLVPARSSTVYNVGSVSKVMTAVAVMQLVESGKVQLDDDVRKFVPSFPDKGAVITIRHLMTHTSGIRHYRENEFPGGPGDENVQPFRTFEDSIAIFKDDPLLFEPGSFFHYSSFAVNLLQGVVEQAGSLPFEEYMRKNVWRPAGMLRTAFDVPGRIVPGRSRSYSIVDGRARPHPYGDLTYKFAGGGMISTVEDLVRFGVALNDGRLLAKESLERMYEVQFDGVLEYQGPDLPGRPADRKRGLMWEVRTSEGRRYVRHAGSVIGFGADLTNHLDHDLVVAVLANNYNAPAGNSVIANFFLQSPK